MLNINSKALSKVYHVVLNKTKNVQSSRTLQYGIRYAKK